MGSLREVNDSIRAKLRSIRHRKGLTVTEVAARAGLPVSSYSCMESGFYRISLDHLYRIIGALDVDIASVWPIETLGSQQAYLRRVQEFRLSELITLTAADGAALFGCRAGRILTLLNQGLDEVTVERLMLYLESGRLFDSGTWFTKRRNGFSLYLFLQTETCPSYVEQLVESYTAIWLALFPQLSNSVEPPTED